MNKINSMIQKKIISFSQASEVFQSLRADGKSISLCHGVFDLLHPGHLRHLTKAKELADVLVVSITADKFVNKGPGRPVFSEQLRAESLSNLVTVDYVVITPHETAIEVLTSVKPNFYVKGKDYADEESDKTGNISKEKSTVENHGGRIIFTDELVFSSSQLINQFIPAHNDEVSSWLKEIKAKYSISEIISWIEKVSRLKVAVIGETIIDIYTECEALGKSSKDPTLCFNKGNSVSFPGGVLAIGAHTTGLGVETTIFTGLNSRDENLPVIQKLFNTGTRLRYVDISPSPTIRKERLFDSRTTTRVLELYEMNDNYLPDSQNYNLIKMMKENINDFDAIIVADYGHGLISEAAIKFLCESSKFIAVNTQLNAGNRGLNSITRYNRFDFATLNGLEAQLEIRRKHIDIKQFIEQLIIKSNADKVLVTKGGSGLELFSKDEESVSSPALAPYVKDRVGAGDAVLSLTSLLVAVNAPAEVICFLGSIVGAWAVSFVGNEKTLDVGTLVRYTKSVLA